MSAPEPIGLSHAQVNHMLGDDGLPPARPATIRSWVRRRLVVRALDGGIDRPSLSRFIEHRKEQIAAEAARQEERRRADSDGS